MCVILLTEEGERYFCEKKNRDVTFYWKKIKFRFLSPPIKKNKKKFSLGFSFVKFHFRRLRPFALLWGLALAITTKREALSFPCIVDSIIETPKELSITYIPFVGVPAYATSSNFGKLQFSIPHTALPSPHTGNFLINYFLVIFQFFRLGFI